MKKEKELAKIPDEFNENDFEENLTPKQRLFCFHFVKNKATKFNATLSYNKAYEIGLESKDIEILYDEKGEEIPGTSEFDKFYSYCASAGSRLYGLIKIQKEIDRLLYEGLNEEAVDIRLAQIVSNSKDETAILGIREFNAIKGRNKATLDINGKIEMSPEDEEVYKSILQKNKLGNKRN